MSTFFPRPYKNNMVQTKIGAKNSEWLKFIAEMSKVYRERHAVAADTHAAAAEPEKELKAPRRRHPRKPRGDSSNAPEGAMSEHRSGTSCPEPP
jgi:hypothetical protein